MVKEITDHIKKSRIHWSEWRLEAKENYDFYAGTQWDTADAEKLKNQGRTPVVFNRIVRTINSVKGVEVQNRQEVKYYPRNINVNQQDPNAPTDSGLADTLNSAASWAREQCNAEDEESEAFEDLLICGLGFTETRMDYDSDPQGIIVKDRLDPLDVYVDPESKKRNFEDAKWIAVVKEMTKREIREMFPDAPDIDSGTLWNDEDILIHDQTDEWKYINNYADQIQKVGMRYIVQYQYYTKENVYIVLTSDLNIVTFDEKRYKKVKKLIDSQSLKVIKIKKRVYRQCFLVGNSIQDDMELGCDHFTIRGMTALRDRNKNTYFGLVSLMKDPQRWANKWLSQIQFILNSNAKGGLMVEEGAVEDIRNLEDDWSSPDSVIRLLPGGLSKIQEKKPIDYPDGIDRLLNYAIQAINDIPGVNLEMIGMAARDQPIGLEMTRKDAAITVLATFFDSLRRYRKVDGKILAYFIQNYISDGRLIRIVGEDGVSYVPLLKDKVSFEYDVVVDEASTSPNNKDKIFYMLNQIIPMALQAGIPVPKEVLDYVPLPFDLIQKWKQTIVDQSQPDPQAQAIQQKLQEIQMVLAQLEIPKKQAEIANKQSDTTKNYADAQKSQAVGQEQSALAAQKGGMLMGDQAIKVQNMQADQQRKNAELIMNQTRKMLEVHLDAKLRAQKQAETPSLAEIQ